MSSIQALFLQYFGDIGLKRIKRDGQWSVYCAKCHSNLNSNRYIFVIVEDPGYFKDDELLGDLRWVSFQTRTTDDVYPVPTHSIIPSEEQKKALSSELYVLDRVNGETQYISDTQPIKVRLIHDRRKNNHLQYPDKTLLYKALNTFNCVVETL